MPVQTSVITGTVAHKHSATGGSSDGGKLAVGGLGGDTSFDLTNGSIMYSNGTSLEELTIGNAADTLTVSGGVPAWGAAGGGATTEFIATQTSTGNDFTTFTFGDAVDFDDYSAMIAYFSIGTNGSFDLQCQVGDTSGGGLETGGYQYCKADNNAATWTAEYSSGSSSFSLATHPRLDSGDGCSGYISVYKALFNTGNDRLMLQSFAQGHDSSWISTCYNTNTLSDLKYFWFGLTSNDLVSGSNISCYKIRRS